MSNIKITQLPELAPTPLTGSDVFPVVSGNVTYQVTANAIAAFAGGTPTTIVNGTSNVAIATANANVVVGFAGSDTFTFGTDGNLTLLHGSKISEVDSPVPGNYALAMTGTGITDPDQQLLVYPTSLDAKHLHLTTGNLYNAELFLGNDDLYVKLANTGNVIINSNDGNVTTAQWSFNPDGNLALPGNTFSVNYANGTPVSLGGAVDTISNGTSNVTIATANANVDINVGEAVSTFDATGNLVLSNGFVIGAPGGVAQIVAPNDLTLTTTNDNPIVLQAIDGDNNVNSSLTLDPNNTLTRLTGYSSQDSNSWTTSDWATGEYTTEGGGTIGAIKFTGATTIIDFINSLPNPEYVFVQVNNGPLLPFGGASSGGSNLTIYVADLPVTDPTTVTDFAYYYSLYSTIEIDYDTNELLISANDADIIVETSGTNDIDINAARRLTLIGNGSIDIRNESSTDGINIVTDNNSSSYAWAFGVNGTLIVPTNGSTSIEGVDTNDISISANSSGGAATASLQNQNNGSITSTVDVSPSEVTVEIDTSTWRFDAAGNLTLPSNTFAVNYANGDPVVIGGGSANTGNIYFNQSAILSNQSNAFVNLNDDVNGKLSLGTTSGSNVQIAVNDIANATGAIWVYDATGNLTLPGNTSSINYANGTSILSGGSSVAEAPFSIQLNDFTATAGSRYGVDTTVGGWIATLPASPTQGDAVYFADAGGAYSTNPFIVNPGVNTIMGVGGSMTVTTNGQSFGLFWNGTTWRTYS